MSEKSITLGFAEHFYKFHLNLISSLAFWSFVCLKYFGKIEMQVNTPRCSKIVLQNGWCKSISVVIFSTPMKRMVFSHQKISVRIDFTSLSNFSFFFSFVKGQTYKAIYFFCCIVVGCISCVSAVLFHCFSNNCM